MKEKTCRHKQQQKNVQRMIAADSVICLPPSLCALHQNKNGDLCVFAYSLTQQIVGVNIFLTSSSAAVKHQYTCLLNCYFTIKITQH